MIPVDLPAGVQAFADRGADWAAWVDGLPRLVGDLVESWALTLDGPATHGHTALVVPVRTSGGAAAMLKVGFPHEEAEHEHLALQRWGGQGAVRLLRADPHRSALLLERLHPEDLGDLDDESACEIVAGLYGRLHVPAGPQYRTLSSYVRRENDLLRALPRSAPLPHRLVEQAISLTRDLLADGCDGTLIHTDLHYANVLAADREPWLAIDPKPLSGDPHYEPAPMLWNRLDERVGDLREGVRRRFFALVDTAELDEDRARAWVIVRLVHRAAGALDDPDVTSVVALAKAVQD